MPFILGVCVCVLCPAKLVRIVLSQGTCSHLKAHFPYPDAGVGCISSVVKGKALCRRSEALRGTVLRRLSSPAFFAFFLCAQGPKLHKLFPGKEKSRFPNIFWQTGSKRLT